MKKRMSEKSLKNLKSFKKGQSGNPEGARLHDPEMKAIKKLTTFELKELGSVLVRKDLQELKRIANAKSGVAWIHAVTAKIAWKALELGDEKKYEAILQRIVGKVPFVAEVSGPGGGPIVSGNMSEEEILKRQLAIDKKLAETDDE